MTTETTVETTLALAGAPAIDGLRFRRLRADDATDWDDLATVVRASNRADDIPFSPSGSLFREEVEGTETTDPSRDLVVAEVHGVQVGNAGADRVLRGDSAVYELWGHVDPTWRRRGIGRTLLAENLRRARERAVGDPPELATLAGAFVDANETGHRHLVEAAGFAAVRWFFLMRRDGLADIPEAPLPDGLEIRTVTPDQHRAIFDAEDEAFRDHWEARRPEPGDFDRLFAKADIDTGLWVVAWDGDEVAGVVQTWIWKDENAELGVDRGWLEHISVRRPWRRRGLGRALTAAALRRLQAAGMSEAMLGVDADNPTGALGLYEGLGFTVHQRSTAYRLPLQR